MKRLFRYNVPAKKYEGLVNGIWCQRNPITNEYWTSKEEYESSDLEGFYEQKHDESVNSVLYDTEYSISVENGEVVVRGISHDGFLLVRGGERFFYTKTSILPPEGLSVLVLDEELRCETDYVGSNAIAVLDRGASIKIYETKPIQNQFVSVSAGQPLGEYVFPLVGYVKTLYIRPQVDDSVLKHGNVELLTIPHDAPSAVKCVLGVECTPSIALKLSEADDIQAIAVLA